jgi:hypothetical protein
MLTRLPEIVRSVIWDTSLRLCRLLMIIPGAADMRRILSRKVRNEASSDRWFIKRLE